MTEFRGAWTAEEVATFLHEATIPIRIATRRSNDSLWPVTVWYRYRDGYFESATHASADLVGLVKRNPAVGFDVSTNQVPYSGVRGTGTASVTPDEGRHVLRDLTERYLGGTDSRLARRLLDDDREEVVIRIDPEEIYSWDYTERMKDVPSQ